MTNDNIATVADWIADADGLVITTGAGMGVDSGLPDFRGNEGFWKAYPALGRARMEFTAIANGRAFTDNPRVGWGFYGHRLSLYRNTVPHVGFSILKRITERLKHGYFVVTSNVDGQFQKAGFDPQWIREIHGSIHHLQCAKPCSSSIWPANSLEPEIDEELCQWIGPTLPTCPSCGSLARPNILMFDDWLWVSNRSDSQRGNWNVWSDRVQKPVVIEIGAGVEVASIRAISTSLKAPVARINIRHPTISSSQGIGLAMGGKEALLAIEQRLEQLGFLPTGN